MKNNWLIAILDLIIATIIVSFIFLVGDAVNDYQWEKDCTTMSMHRVKNIVYKCEVIK